MLVVINHVVMVRTEGLEVGVGRVRQGVVDRLQKVWRAQVDAEVSQGSSSHFWRSRHNWRLVDDVSVEPLGGVEVHVEVEVLVD